MEGALKSFRGHVPDSIKTNNPYLDKLLSVLDGMLKVREDELFSYTRSFLHPLVSDVKIMRRYIDEWNAEYTSDSTRLCLDCLYRKYHDIYSRKGTIQGLENLLYCLILVDSANVAVSVLNYTAGKPLILFNDNKAYDWLPTDVEIAAEILAAPGEEQWCPTLLDDTWLHQKAVLTILLSLNGGSLTAEYIEFLKSVIVLYLPMISRDFVIINIV